MRLLINILYLLMLLVVLSADNCSGPVGNNEANRERQISNIYQNIENEFIKDELSIEDLNVFEIRAVQKLKDIADYININADSGISIQFRKQANQMIGESFFERNDEKIFFKNLNIREDTLNTVLYSSKNGRPFKTDFKSIEILDHFQKESDLRFNGVIQFTQLTSFLNQKDTAVTSTMQRIEMIAVKTGKNFGNETQEVWEVYFSDTK